ncbi:membrane protein FxsA [Mycobacterium sp. MBM]|nr:membrane protein FxsA [Mycobacterium sp. MBM]
MAKRLFLVYLLVEVAVLVALVSTIGFGWTVLAVLATFVVGLAVAGSQIARHIRRLQEALNSRSAGGELATDSALVALGAVLVMVPGLASSVLGALLLIPPTRRIARPVAGAVIGRSLAGSTPLVMTYTAGRAGYRQATRTDYVDGEVIDVVDTEPTSLERRHNTGD